MLKKSSIWLLMLCLILSMMTVSVFADETASNTAAADGEVTSSPNATVSVKAPIVLTAANDKYMCWPSGDATVDRPLQIVMNFKANETREEAEKTKFANWKCDFYLSFKGLATGKITADGCYLAGNYGTFGWIVIPTDGLELEEGVEYPVVSAYDANLKYAQDICGSVKDFTAAIYVAPAILEANPDFEVTLALKMTNPDDENDVITVGNPASYNATSLGLSNSVPAVEDNGIKDNEATLNSAREELVALGVSADDAANATAEVNVTIVSVPDANGKIVYNVAPTLSAGGKSVKMSTFASPVTFRLPVLANETKEKAKVYHNDELLGLYDIKEANGSKYVEVSSYEFSEFAVEPTDNVVAKIGDTTYQTLLEALDAAKAMTGDVVITIVDRVVLNTNLSGNYDSIKFVGNDADAEIYLDVQGYITASGEKVAFDNLILSKSEGGYITNAGFMNVAFGVYDVAEVTYTNCTFENGAYASSGKVVFDGCTFKRSYDKYGLWAYGNVDVTVNNSTFADYRGIKMYAEGAAKTVELTVTNTDFSAVTDKPAIVLTYGESVELDGNTYSTTGAFELDLDGAPNGTLITVDADEASKITAKNDNGACGVIVDGKIYTTVAQAAAVATSGSTVTLLHDSEETVEFAEGVTLNTNGYTANGVTVKVSVAKIGDTGYETIAAAIAAAQDGDVVTILPGEYGSINISNKNITIQGTVGDNGELLTTIKGGNPAITGHNFNGTIKDLKIVDAWKVMYAEPAGNVTVDNVYVTGATYGLHLVAYSEGLTWTIQNSYMDLAWANSFGVYGNGDAAIVIEGNEFESTNPYYPEYGAIHVNSFLPNVTVQENVFGENAKIYIDKSVTDTSNIKISGNYHADGVENAFADDADGVKTIINEYYTDEALTNLVKRYVMIGDTYYATLAEAVAAAQAGDEIVLLADLAEDVTVPAGVIFNGNGKQVGVITAAGEITFKGHTKATEFGTQYTNTTINIGEGACLEITGTGRMVIGHGCTFNIVGEITDAKTANVADLTPSLIMPGASFTGAGVTFNVTNAYIKTTASYCSSSKSASGTFDFNIINSIWEQFGKLAFESQSTAATVNFELKDSVLTTTSHLVFGVSRGEIVIDNSNVNVGTSRQIENQSTMTVKNGSVVNGAVATSSNAKNPGTLIIDNATYAVTGEFSGSDLGTGTLIVNNGASFTAGSITKANIEIDATGMAAGDTVNITADLSKFAGTIEVVNNGALETKIDDGKIVLIEKPVAEVDGVKYTSLQAALDAAAAGTGNVTVEILCDIDLTGIDWNPVTVSAPGYPLVTVNGNDKTITGLNDMLFAGTWAGKSGLIINDLTIKDSTIVNDKDDTQGTVGVGAFIGYPQASATITLNNCHLVDSHVEGGHWTGGLIGMAGGYSGNDGPVFMNLTITGCSVTGSTITGKGSVGGVIGHGSCDAWTNLVIEDTTVSGNTVTSTGSSANKAGAVMGTIGAAGQTTTVNGVTLTGGASVSATVSGNTVTSNGTTITTIYGRQGTATGALELTGGSYDSYPIETGVSYAGVAEGFILSENSDGTYGVKKFITNNAYVSEDGGWTTVWGEAKINGTKNFYIEIYSGTTYLGKTTLKDLNGGILNGVDNSVTWHAFINGSDDWWTTEWEVSPICNLVPTNVKYYVDDELAGEGTVQLNGPDNLSPVVWGALNGVYSEAKIGDTYYASLQAAIDAANVGDTVTLLEDVTLSSTIIIEAGKKIILDLNGKTISGTDDTIASFSLITNKGELTIMSSVEGGAITLVATNDNGYNRYSSVISNTVGGKLTVESGTIEHLGGHTMAYAIDNLTNGKGTYAETVINGGTIKSSYVGIRQFLNGVEADNILTVNGGTVTGNNTSIFFQDPSKNCNSGKLVVTENATLGNRIYVGGTEYTAWDVEISVSAAALGSYGITTDEIPATSVIMNVNGTYGVVDAVASVNNIGYATLKEAIDAAQAGDTVTLLADIELSAPITVKKAIILDGQDFTITQSAECNNNIALLYFEDAGDVTVKNVTFDGLKTGAAIRTLRTNITIDNVVFQNCEHTVGQGLVRLTVGNATIKNSQFINNNCSMGVSFNWDAGDSDTDVLTIDNCVFERNTANKTALVYYVLGAGCEIKNSEFVDNTVNCDSNGATIYLGFQDNCTVTGNLFKDNTVIEATDSIRVAGAVFAGYQATITGNVFDGNSATNVNGDALGQDICISTYYEEGLIDLSGNFWGGNGPVPGVNYFVQHQTGEGTIELKNYYKSYELDEDGNVVLEDEISLTYVAQIGKYKYETLADAFAAAVDDETITLVADTTLDTMITNTKKVTLDLNGKTINAGWDDEAAGKHIYVITNEGTLTITGNGTINTRGIYNKGSLTLENGTINAIDANGGYAVVSYSGATFTMNGGAINTTYEDGDEPGNGYDATTVRVEEGATFTMNGGEINNISNFTFAIDNYGTTIIKGGTVTSVHTTVANFGTMMIEGGTFVCNGLEGITAHAVWASAGILMISGGTFDGKDNFNGFNVDASAGATVYITGGEFLSVHSGSLYGDGTIAVSGGKFFDSVEEDRCANGYIPTENGDGTYGVKEGKYVARVNGVGYESFEEALNAGAGKTIVLLSDVTVGQLMIVDNTVLDLNGFTMTASYVAAFNGSSITDSGETKGLLAVPKGNFGLFAAKYPMLPVWNEAGTGYIFVAVTDQVKPIEIIDEDSFAIEFRPSIAGGEISSTDILADGAADNGIIFKVNIHCYKEGAETEVITLLITDELISKVYTNLSSFRIVVNGASVQFDRYEIEIEIVTESNLSYKAIIGEFKPTTESSPEDDAQ